MAADSYPLSVVILGTGEGTVNSEPAGINCNEFVGDSCSNSFDTNSVVTLTATAPSGSIFTGWWGACSNDPCEILINSCLIQELKLKKQQAKQIEKQ